MRSPDEPLPARSSTTESDGARDQLPWRAALVLSLATLGLTGAGAAAEWTPVAEERAIPASSVKESVWQSARPPGGEHDRIRVHRYRGPSSRAALLYLPGTNMNGTLPDLQLRSSGILEPGHNLWLWLAERGVEVWTLDYRTHTVSADDSPPFGFMASWTMEAFTDDAAAALALSIREGGLPTFVAGFSRGASFAYTLACAAPEQLAGMVALDGFFKRAQAGDAQPILHCSGWAFASAASFIRTSPLASAGSRATI